MDLDTSMGGNQSRFPETRRSALIDFNSGDPVLRDSAAEALISAYWKPVYKYIRVRLREAVTLPAFSATRYELIGEIGGGGMGAVYVGRDTQLDRRVALKVLTVVDGDGQASARMAEEARILARLEHPGIVPVHDLGRLPDGRIFYAMKMVELAFLVAAMPNPADKHHYFEIMLPGSILGAVVGFATRGGRFRHTTI